MQEEIDWGSVPSRLCNEMKREKRRPIVKASGGGWKGVEDGEEMRREEENKAKGEKEKQKREEGKDALSDLSDCDSELFPM